MESSESSLSKTLEFAFSIPYCGHDVIPTENFTY